MRIMAKRIMTKVGDVFCVKIDDEHKRYFQYIISDLTCLNSDVIRVFKKVYSIDEEPELSEIVKGEVDFYSHCMTSAGIKRELWEKTGNIKEVGEIEHIFFKDKMDYTREDIEDDWRIWRINQDIIHVGRLSEENKKGFLGLVFTPESILHKIRTGICRGVYSKYE